MKKRFIIQGYDAWGNPVIETIEVKVNPLWKRILLRIGRLFGYGKWKVISSISMKEDQ